MTKEEFKMEVRNKKAEFKAWCHGKVIQARVFWNENRDYIVVLAPIVCGVGGKVISSVDRKHRINEEKDLKERYIYDRSLGCYYELKHQPKPSEYLEIDRRRRNGEPLGRILQDMRLLK